jgi:sugar lactone lactonase YvrE
VDKAGNVYVADTGNDTIRKMTPQGLVTTLAGMAGQRGSMDGTGSKARFADPFDVTVDSAGNIYVADEGNDTIRKVTSDGMVTTLAGLVGNFGSTDGTGSAARFGSKDGGPSGVAVDGEGDVYVTDTQNHTIRKVTPTGVVTTLAGNASISGYGWSMGGSTDGTGSEARFNYPWGVAVDKAGTIYVADSLNHTIRKVTRAGVVSTLAGQTGLTGPAALANVGSADRTGNAARFRGPQRVAVDSTGNVYVADTGNRTIRRITPAGVVTTLAGQVGSNGNADGTGSVARFGYPNGVAVDNAGNVYEMDSDNSTIRKGFPAITTP